MDTLFRLALLLAESRHTTLQELTAISRPTIIAIEAGSPKYSPRHAIKLAHFVEKEMRKVIKAYNSVKPEITELKKLERKTKRACGGALKFPRHKDPDPEQR